MPKKEPKQAKKTKNDSGPQQTKEQKVDGGAEQAKKPKSNNPHRAVPIFLVALSLFLAFCFIIQDLGEYVGEWGHAISAALRGCFSYGAYAIPALMLLHAILYFGDKRSRRLFTRTVFSLILVIAIGVFAHTVAFWNRGIAFDASVFFEGGRIGVGGGLIGGAVGYGLIRVIGKIGVIILLLLFLALYITYFFSRGGRIFKKMFMGIFKRSTNSGDGAEHNAKKEAKSEVKKEVAAKKKDKRVARIDDRKHRQLMDDEFFDVDNGIARLDINDLGISEERSTISMETRPTLQEKIRHKSELDEEAMPISDNEGGQTIYTPDFTEIGADGPVKKTMSYDYSLDEDFNAPEDDTEVFDGEFTAPAEPSAVSVGSDDSADALFNSNFDPFELVMSEELANKPSSRSLLDEKPSPASAPTVKESLSEITEEDIEKARRNAEFERRKTELLAKQKENRTDESEKEVSFTSSEPENLTAAVAPEHVSVKMDKNEPTPTYVEREPVTMQQPKTYVTVETASEIPSSPYIPVGQSQSTPYNGYGHSYRGTDTRDDTYRSEFRSLEGEYYNLYSSQANMPTTDENTRAAYKRAAGFAAATVRSEAEQKPQSQPSHPYYDNLPNESTQYSAPAKTTPSYAQQAPVYAEPAPVHTEPVTVYNEPAVGYGQPSIPVQSNSSYDVYAPKIERDTADTYTPYTPTVEKKVYSTVAADEEYIEPTFSPYSDIGEEKKEESGLVFEFDTRKHLSGTADEPRRLETERSFLTEVDEEDESDYTEPTDEDISDAEDSGWSEEEIPPEEQNPEVSVMRDMFTALRRESADGEEEDDAGGIEIHTAGENYTPIMPEYNEDDIISSDLEEDEEDSEDAEELPFEAPTVVRSAPEKKEDKPAEKKKPNYKNYKKPPLELMGIDVEQDDEEITAEIQENTRIIIETLASFNVTASIKGVDRGPRITRYEVVPAKGVKVNQITHLFDDITLNLAADGIRMEAPIPGKSAIGFEIPNKNPATVRLRELLECEEFQNAKSNTFVCIGKDVAGNPVFGDIGKFPHALIAGATGMGKSVAINSIMISMLYKARPDQVKFIMIDPKKVEFRMYSGIPHLLIPVITEAKQAAGALMWAVEEMERRYDLIEKLNIRNIEAYNERQAQDPSIGEHMPKIVIVIDELNDLMMQVRDPVEDLIMRIAQKARAAGIHLIIGTQRPDVKVITGTIKANINTRLSCKVTSVVDSRTILEMAGAEKLLNKGDMLFKPVDKTKPIRVQGAFVSDSEVEAIMDFLKEQDTGAQYDDEIFAEINKAAQKCGNKKSGAGSGGDDDFDGGDDACGYYNDQKFLDAVELAIRSRKISTSLLQRKMSIGYGKAAKYIDAMEEIGVVGEPNGQKPRDVLITIDEWYEKLSRVGND